jgi:hypothetical protein
MHQFYTNEYFDALTKELASRLLLLVSTGFTTVHYINNSIITYTVKKGLRFSRP